MSNVQPFDEAAINLIRQQVEAERYLAEEKKRQNELAEEALQLSKERDRKQEVVERTRTRLLLEISERVGSLIHSLPQVFLTIHGLDETLAELTRRVDRIDEVLLILLTGRGNGNKSRVDELKEELHKERGERSYLSRLRALLTEGFDESELRIFCYDTPGWGHVHEELASVTSKAQIVSKIIEYATQKNLTDELLGWVKATNPAKYEQYTR